MKVSRLFMGFIIGVLTTALGLVAFASGPIYPFDDVNDGDWYQGPVTSLYLMGVVEGYEDGLYHPENNVNRAEMAVMLDRLYEYIKYPFGTEAWEIYENDYYTVAYPVGDFYPLHGPYTDAGDEMGCSSGLPTDGDFLWMISCHDLSETSMDEVVASVWDHMGDERYEQRRELWVNGEMATEVIVSSSRYPDIQIRMVFIEDEWNNMLYEISSDSDLFFQSFQLKDSGIVID